MLTITNDAITSEIDALLLFATAITLSESGYLRPVDMLALKSTLLNNLDVSDRLTPETVRVICCGCFRHEEIHHWSCEGYFLAPWRFERVNGDITLDNIDTP